MCEADGGQSWQGRRSDTAEVDSVRWSRYGGLASERPSTFPLRVVECVSLLCLCLCLCLVNLQVSSIGVGGGPMGGGSGPCSR